jgi:nucleoside-diphosphate-sugar epimerase
MLRWVRGDVCDISLVNSLLAGTDMVFHLAAESHVTRYFCDPILFDRVKNEGTKVMLEASVACGVRRFVRFSTDEVYVTCLTPVGENQPFAPSSPYALSKTLAEAHVADYQKLGLDMVVLRPSNAVGVG